MKKAELSYTARMNDMIKANASLERAKKSYDKKLANAVKLGVDQMTNEEHLAWLKTVPCDEYGFMQDKEAIKKNGAWFDLLIARQNLEGAEYKVQKAEEQLNKAEEAFQNVKAEEEMMADAKMKEALWEEEFEKEQKEWAKDGINLMKRYEGMTPKGQHFMIYGNSGWTMRSRHCVTLYVNGNVIFTSGEFWRAYMEIKAR